MTTFAEIIAAARFTADMVGSDRVLGSEWCPLVGDAIHSAWRLAASARPDFSYKSQDFTLTSGTSASFTVPSDFEAEIDVVYAPDTSAEYSLGSFAWQNRRSPGGWLPWGFGPNSAIGGARARLVGDTVFVEPASQAGGIYRLWYLPRPQKPDFTHTVRVATSSALGVSIGPGPHQLTGGLGPLVIDGVTMQAGDRILLKDQSVAPQINGIYTVTDPGSGISVFVLTRATDYDQTSEIAVGNLIIVTEGTVNKDTLWRLNTFAGTVETDPMVFGAGAIDNILVPFRELITVATALPAIDRDDDLPIQRLEARRAKLEGELQEYMRRTRTANLPGKPIDTDMRGPAAPAGWGAW